MQYPLAESAPRVPVCCVCVCGVCVYTCAHVYVSITPVPCKEYMYNIYRTVGQKYMIVYKIMFTGIYQEKNTYLTQHSSYHHILVSRRDAVLSVELSSGGEDVNTVQPITRDSEVMLLVQIDRHHIPTGVPHVDLIQQHLWKRLKERRH